MGSVAVLMKQSEVLKLVAEALAEVYSGAGILEASALCDKLADAGLLIVFDINDPRTLED